jgi:enoyl-CoA hydratase/carnithine racemase
VTSAASPRAVAEPTLDRLRDTGAMSTGDALRLERPADGVVRLTLARPDKRNALSIALRDEISDALDALADDDTVRAVIVTGEGSTFCAGFDLSEFTVDDAEFQQRLWASSDRYHRTVLCFPLPIIAAVNGPALAGGFDLAVMCDIRVAADTAVFAHPENRFGDVVYGPLHALVGGSIARDLCLTGRRIDAAEALAMRIVSRVVAVEELAAVALDMAVQIAAAPREVSMRTKAKALRAAGVDPDAPTLSL